MVLEYKTIKPNKINKRMTFYIDLKSAEKLPFHTGVIYVQNQNGHSLVTPSFNTNSPKFKQPFRIVCSKDDHLTFKICQNLKNEAGQKIVGIAKFHAPVFLKNYAHKLEKESQSEYDIIAYSCESDKEAGYFNLLVRYDKSQVYQGELAGEQKVHSKKKNYASFYKGPCPTKNLFSMLDPGPKREKHKILESFYVDDLDREESIW